VSPRSTSTTFAILPAIDLRDGRVVRLRQGDFAREQIYADDPTAVARDFASAGAEWIHVVDLDGARVGERRQSSTIAGIVDVASPAGVRVQVAGGIRTLDDIDAVLVSGADRVVLGTAALVDAGLVRIAVERHGPERIAVALDVRGGNAVGDGWVPNATAAPLGEAQDRLTRAGVTTFIVTAIARDGLLGGPDLAMLESIVRTTSATVLASGGIRTVSDLEATRVIGCAGAIVGRAIYDGSLDLTTAIAAMRDGPTA
jgi:phosphoribosylformimino-5-aminoimidazole carboxamide ribotide isomerase